MMTPNTVLKFYVMPTASEGTDLRLLSDLFISVPADYPLDKEAAFVHNTETSEGLWLNERVADQFIKDWRESTGENGAAYKGLWQKDGRGGTQIAIWFQSPVNEEAA
ncbi:hypothetical protein N9917_01565 [Deltaproteobacteria bacterium]|nr:hypothetical protein [Deltaproteobacteria bacterium]